MGVRMFTIARLCDIAEIGVRPYGRAVIIRQRDVSGPPLPGARQSS